MPFCKWFWRTARSLALGSLGVLLPALGHAQSGRVTQFEAPVGCPDAAWFEQELANRSSAGAGSRGGLSVNVAARGAEFVGRVERGDPASPSEAREVRHASCEQVMRALALIGALLLERDRAPEAPAGPPESPARDSRHAVPVAAAEPARPAQPRRLLARKASAGRSARMRHGPSAALTLQGLIAPEVQPGPRIGYRALLELGPLEWEIGLSAARIVSSTLWVPQFGSAELTYVAARLQFCSAFALLERKLLAGPCAGLDVGALSGRGHVSNGTSKGQSSLWLAPGLQGRLEWRGPGPLFAALAAGFVYPLSRPEFHFTDQSGAATERTIRAIPAALGFAGDLSLGFLFP